MAGVACAFFFQMYIMVHEAAICFAPKSTIIYSQFCLSNFHSNPFQEIFCNKYQILHHFNHNYSIYSSIKDGLFWKKLQFHYHT